TNKIKVIAGKVDSKTPGIYPITYQVTDSANHTTEKEITITVTSKENITDLTKIINKILPSTGNKVSYVSLFGIICMIIGLLLNRRNKNQK
ncbi:immunoglobulin-like domain-containing protein, partial [Bacillus cereus]